MGKGGERVARRIGRRREKQEDGNEVRLQKIKMYLRFQLYVPHLSLSRPHRGSDRYAN